MLVEQRRHHAPLVEAEVVDDNKEHFFACVEQREYFFAEHLVAHERVLRRCNPCFVVAFNELGKCVVGFGFLHLQQFVHVCFGAR